ncbi:MAG: ROK family protein [Ignavibacteriae bacterium]|nr:ROK family protein [Ignavibacteriota bacterium]
MKYFIGIDGGGTKTKCVLCDENLKIICSTQSGPSNFLTIGTEIVSQTILDLIKKCCDEIKISTNELTGIVLGTTGAGRESDADKLKNAIINSAKNQNLLLNNFEVVSDARIALEGAFSGNPGSILISGTGSIMFGKDANGIIHRVGGFGRLIGDEGSGYSIGKKGLNQISKYFDGRGKETLLQKLVEENFNISDQSKLISKVYNNELNIQDVAPLVIQAANNDDLCRNILDEETNELLLHILAMTKKLNCEEMKIVFIGGIITNESLFSKMLKEIILTFLPKVKIQDSEFPPEIGAVIMAKKFSEQK